MESSILSRVDPEGPAKLLHDPAEHAAATAGQIEAALADLELRRARLVCMVEEGVEHAEARSRDLWTEIKTLKEVAAAFFKADRQRDMLPTCPVA